MSRSLRRLVPVGVGALGLGLVAAPAQAPVCTAAQVVANPGFESGATSWTASPRSTCGCGQLPRQLPDQGPRLRLGGRAVQPLDHHQRGRHQGQPDVYRDAHPTRYGTVVYGYGKCMLHDLRRTIGATAMTGLLRNCAAAHRFGVSTPADFTAAAQAATTVDLTSFWTTHRV